MADALPPALVDLLREMRAAGVSINGLREATGINARTIIKYTSDRHQNSGVPVNHAPIGDRTRKWTDEANKLLCDEWSAGATLDSLVTRINAMLGRSDITARAVRVRIAQLKLHRPTGFQNEEISAARRAYWERWRRGQITDNRRCPPQPEERKKE